MEKKKLISLAISSGIGLLVFLLWIFSALDLWENKILDSHFTRRGFVQPSDKIVIVAVDEESINKLGRWPWARSVQGTLVEKLTLMGAKAIVFDILFTESDQDRPWADEQMGKQAQKSGKVVLGCFFQMDSNGAPIKSLEPIEAIKKKAQTGFVNIFTEMDGINRKVSLLMEFEGKQVPSLGLAGLSLYFDKSPEEIVKEHNVVVDAYNEMMVNFAGGYESFPYYSFSKVINGEISADKIKDKIVLVGGTASALFDFKAIPFSPVFPGVEIHANAMSNILQNNFLKPWPAFVTFLLIVIFSLLAGLVFGQFAPWKGGVSTVAVFTGYFIFTYYMFKSNIIAEFAAPAASLSLSYVGVLFYRFMTEEKEKRWIKKSFSQYFSPSVMDQILNNPAALALGGQKMNVTIMFSDIRSFTSISENMKPEEVVAFLNEYLGRMVEIVFKHDGTLDKFIGDAVMAIWGAPIPHKDHHKKAVECAIEMIEEVEKLNAKWISEGKKPIKIGIGLNSGDVNIGNIGSDQKKEYTVIGDSVNLASRLEGINKEFKTVIIISENTYAFVKDSIEAEHLGGVQVKGKEKVVDIYGVFGHKGNTNKDIFRLPDTGKQDKVSDKEHAKIVSPAIKKAEAEKEEKEHKGHKEHKPKFNPDERIEMPKK